ncbi:AraC-type DNA-binding domain-containing protein [Hahella chejuensis KCTC 2396]|uniref:AraC-type DNA-binding domain-containing protein n=1 Tax=Hahella chejuensis (strain KCTC 2396) TaxID=349521 RepID=Q2S734_HAHCH|nr:AraC family transcriptional regulator [Hahella chejuensis]ABC33540.1 AraC-type DNA-binding domain-containing protein [Hahella chejuensis KCTC 2396]
MSEIFDRIKELARLIQRHCPTDGVRESDIPRLSFIRSSSPTEPVLAVHQPAVCIVAQGAKKVISGEQLFKYDAAHYLVVSVDLPIAGQVMQASPEQPYLCVRLDLDLTILSELILDEGSVDNSAPHQSVGVSLVTPRLLEAVIRLVALLNDNPKDIAVLAPLAEKEILYWLANGDQGGILREITNGDSRIRQISKAIQHIKTTFDQPFDMDELLKLTCMSASSFFHHFRTATHMTPLQYQKQLRLLEARRRLFLGEQDICNIGYGVGYDSPSQFSREYARLFGLPPSKDLARIKNAGSSEYWLP